MLCQMFAFAIPTEAALMAIKSKGLPVVELGAGTGYWASLLQRRGVSVDPFDLLPLQQASKKAKGNRCKGSSRDPPSNEYHADVHPFCTVLRGSAAMLRQKRYAAHALLLCYPPPNDPMALECLKSFQGDVLILVGEWEGDTGTREFEARLKRDFLLSQRVPLPNLDRANSLMVWHRKASTSTVGADPLDCSFCGVATQVRCRFCRAVTYCSAACAHADASHTKDHALRLVFLPPEGSGPVGTEDGLVQPDEQWYAPRDFFAFADSWSDSESEKSEQEDEEEQSVEGQ